MSEVARPRGCLADMAMRASSVPPGVAGTRGVVCTSSGGLRPGRIQRSAAGTRGEGSGEQNSGRPRTVALPLGGHR